MQTTNLLVYHMHSAYCDAIEFRIILTLERQRELEALIARGITLDDFRLVLRWLNLKIAKGERNQGALRWSNLIWSPDRFEEELALARAEQRNRRPAQTPKERVLAQARPMACEPQATSNCRPVSELIQDLRRAAGML